ncbi:MAG: P-loop NTPase fold protein [Chloroflexota bacterium]
MQMRFLPDTPIDNPDEDSLDFSSFVNLIQQSLENTDPPFVYGVLGDWGTGKTSTLRLLENQLADHPTILPIWFNAWKYENEANIIYPLLHEIKLHYEKTMAKDVDNEFGRAFKEVMGTSFLALGDIGLRIATKTLTGEGIKLRDVQSHLKAIKEHQGEWQELFSDWADQVGQLEEAFRKLLQAYAKDWADAKSRALPKDVTPNEIRFVILIDDLDRCLPDTTIAILEGIKNYLTATGTSDSPNQSIFILALNAQVVYQGIRLKYKGLEIDGREYLEKILNYSFYVPEPEIDKISTFTRNRLRHLLGMTNDQAPSEVQDKLLNTYGDPLGDVLEKCRFNNPRKIKRILNRYLLFITQFEVKFKDKTWQVATIIRLMILAEYYPILFQFIYGAEKPDTVLRDLHVSTQYADLVNKGYDFKIPSSYPPLFRIKALFKNTNRQLREELDAVFQLTRQL